MARDYNRVLENYEQITKGQALIMCTDLENIVDNNRDLFNLVGNAIKYGYVMGYNRGVKEQRERTKRRLNNGK